MLFHSTTVHLINSPFAPVLWTLFAAVGLLLLAFGSLVFAVGINYFSELCRVQRQKAQNARFLWEKLGS
jgi:hypothetical protein